MAYREATGTLYAVGLPAGGGPEGVGDSLLIIDTTSGAPTEVATLGVDIGGLAFDPNGVLYGGSTSGDLVVIDPVTGVVSPVGPTGFAALSGVAFVPGGGPPVIEVPTATDFGLLLLASGLALAALLSLRRRWSSV